METETRGSQRSQLDSQETRIIRHALLSESILKGWYYYQSEAAKKAAKPLEEMAEDSDELRIRRDQACQEIERMINKRSGNV